MKSDSTSEQPDGTVSEATQWLEILRGNPSAEEREAFVAWVHASRMHLREMLVANLLERELDAMGTWDRIDVDALIERTRAGRAEASAGKTPASVPGPTVRRRRARQPRRMRVLLWPAVAVLVALLVLAGLSAWWWLHPANIGRVHATGLGQHETITLADGSVVKLESYSRIRVVFSADERKVRLLRGQADFRVRRDATRPFRVHAGSSVVRALGTRFRVHRVPDGTVVAVTRGSVRITASDASALGGGIKAWFMSWWPGGSASARRPNRQAIAWRHGHTLTAGETAYISRHGREWAPGLLDNSRPRGSGGDPGTGR